MVGLVKEANFHYAWSEFIINDEEKKGERGKRKRKERKGKKEGGDIRLELNCG